MIRKQGWQNICRIDAHIPEECAQRKWELYLIYGRENHVSPIYMTDGHKLLKSSKGLYSGLLVTYNTWISLRF